MSTPMKVKWEADTSGLGRGQQEALDIVSQGASKMSLALKNAGAGFEGLEKAAKQYKREQVQEGKLVGFYLKEIGEFTGMSKEAGKAIGGLSQAAMALASGSIIGAAFEAVKVIVGYIRDATKETNDKLDALLTKAERARQSAKEQFIADYLKDNGGAKLAEERSAAQDKLFSAVQRLHEEQAKADSLGIDPDQFTPVKIAQNRVEELGRALDEVRVKIDTITGKAAQGWDKEEAAGKVYYGQTSGVGGISGNAVLAGVGTAGANAGEAWRKHFEEEAAKVRDFLARKSIYDQGSLSANVASLRDRQQESVLEKNNEIESQGRADALRQQYAGYGAGAGTQGQGERVAANLEKERNALKQNMQAWQSYGEVAGQALAGLATGTQSMGDVMRSVFKQIMQTLYQYAVSAIMKNAGVAGSEAAAQNSSQGPWGWVVGIAAMGAIFGAVMGLIGQIGSAEGGAVMPSSGGAFPFVLHPKEWVLPAKKAEGLDRLIRSGGRGGGTTVYNISAMDARSFEDYLAANPRAFRNAEARIARKGY